ncbi:hypothetical protein BIY22_13050 [Vibrio panuliri]|uniref:Uncharacterized protein n=2 Tax=Vibrio panuliri TaxID=1381081 RepID=A0A1Q9HAP7_9VIBR|nr:hypothetical protein BIY22_13050 [Vibrio panuliri]
MNICDSISKFLRKVYLIFHTVRYLKFIQIANRITRKFRVIRTQGEMIYTIKDRKEEYIVHQYDRTPYVDDFVFVFLNEVGILTDWNCKEKSKLWLYNLHYFDVLNSPGSNNRKKYNQELIENWIDKNSPCIGNGWEPYTLSLRIVNWIKYFLSADFCFEKAEKSLFVQARVLYQSIEYHLLGNHLFANAKALIFAGVYFEGEESKRWLYRGISILDKEISVQVLNDGGHFELSPMYHNIILSDMLDLYNLSCAYHIEELEKYKERLKEKIEKMLLFSISLTHPDGEVSFFNDSSIGIAPKTSSLFEYAHKLSLLKKKLNSTQFVKESNCSALSFSDSGYVVIDSPECKLIVDCAKVGPDFIPGHAHADSLSFELSLFGFRVFVNSGTSEYGLTSERLRQRRTSSHNTVVINQVDSSEVWGGFRVAKRAYPIDRSVEQEADKVVVQCSHDGYKRLKHKVIHRRKWQCFRNQVIICDNLEGKLETAEAHYHLHPDINAELVGGQVKLVLPNGHVVLVRSSDSVRIIDSTWHPEFGKCLPNKKLLVSFEGNDSSIIIEY